MTETRFTDTYPDTDCPADMQCIQIRGWVKYRARVREVISGQWSQSEVTFALLQHASYVADVIRDCYVILLPASPEVTDKLGVPLVATKLLSNSIKSHQAEINALREGH